jgi:hypothetical protein
MKSQSSQIHRDRKGNNGCERLGREVVGSCSLMGMKIPFCKIRRVLEIEGRLHSSVDFLNVTEQYT